MNDFLLLVSTKKKIYFILIFWILLSISLYCSFFKPIKHRLYLLQIKNDNLLVTIRNDTNQKQLKTKKSDRELLTPEKLNYFISSFSKNHGLIIADLKSNYEQNKLSLIGTYFYLLSYLKKLIDLSPQVKITRIRMTKIDGQLKMSLDYFISNPNKNS